MRAPRPGQKREPQLVYREHLVDVVELGMQLGKHRECFTWPGRHSGATLPRRRTPRLPRDVPATGLPMTSRRDARTDDGRRNDWSRALAARIEAGLSQSTNPKKTSARAGANPVKRNS